MRSKQIFGKRELVDTLSRDLARARNKRDTLAACVNTLTAQIAELEARLSAETVRQARERAASVPLALASVCSTLGLRVGEDPAAARVADTVIKFAQRGIRNPMELRRMTLKQFGFYE
jgi:outer membrane murein-binding lipoprotein Lpp